MGVFGNIRPPVVPCIQPASINDIFMHSLFARVALTDGSTIEFQTKYDPSCNQLELILPPNGPPIFDKMVGVQQGPNLQEFIGWFVGNNGGGGGTDANAIHQSGDSFGADIVIGPKDAHDFVFQVAATAAWRISHTTKALLPEGDKTYDIGSPTVRPAHVIADNFQVYTDGGPGVIASMDQSGLHVGSGTQAVPEILLFWNELNGELYANTHSGTYQLTPPTGGSGTDLNAWHKTGDSFGTAGILGTLDDNDIIVERNGLVRATLTANTLFIGNGTTPYDPSSPEDVQIKRDVDGVVRLHVINPNAGSEAVAAVVLINDLNHYGSLGIPSSGYTGVPFFTGDEFQVSAGSNTSGILIGLDGVGDGIDQYIRFGFRKLNDGPGGTVMRIVHPAAAGRANVLIGNPAPLAPTYGSLLEVRQDFDGVNDIEIINRHDSNLAAAGLYCEADSSNFIAMYAVSHLAAAYEPTMLRDSATLRAGGGSLANGLVISTDTSVPIRARIAGTDRWFIDPSGPMTIDSNLTLTGSETMLAQSADPVVAPGLGIIYTKDDGSGVIELFYRASDGAIFQITSNIPLSSTDANAWHKSGDAFGADEILGTLDNHSLFLYAHGVNIIRIDNGTIAELMSIIGPVNTYASFKIQSNAGVGAGFASYIELENTDGGISYIRLADSGGGDFWFQKEGFLTIAAASGLGVRCTQNGSNNSGWEINTTDNMTIFDELTVTDQVNLHENLNLFTTTPTFGGGNHVVFVADATTIPSTNPTGGGILYSDSGAGKWRGPSGTVSTFGTAEPHCDVCGSDYANEWSNPKWGHLQFCMNCLADHVAKDFNDTLPSWIKRKEVG